jgi:hypothetical protein
VASSRLDQPDPDLLFGWMARPFFFRFSADQTLPKIEEVDQPKAKKLAENFIDSFD